MENFPIINGILDCDMSLQYRLTNLLSRIHSSTILAKLVKGASLVFLIQGLGMGLSYFTQILFVRWMGLKEFGNYTYALTWFQVLVVISMFGLDSGMVRFIPEYMAQHDWGNLKGLLQWSRSWLIISGILIVLLWFLVFQHLWIGTPLLLLGILLIPLLALTETNTQIIRGMKEIVAAYAPTLLVQPLLLIGTASLLLNQFKILTGWLAICAFAGSLAFVLAVQFLFLQRNLSSKIQKVHISYEVRKWLQVSPPLLLVSVFVAVMLRADSLILGLLYEPEGVGIYSVGVKTDGLIGFTMSSAQVVATPLIVERHIQSDRDGVQQIVRIMTFGMFWSAVIIGVSIMLLSSFILDAFGPGFRRAQLTLMILVIGQLINIGMGPVALLLNITGNERSSAFVLGLSALLNIILCWVLIPFFGMEGAAIASTASTIFWNIWLGILVKRRLNISSSVIFASTTILFNRR